MTSIPDELRQRPQWVCWRYELRDGERTKVPYNARTGRKASSTDPQTWCEYATARRAASRYDGIGFVFTKDDPFVGIDLDDCIDGNGGMAGWARDILTALPSYAEISPSGQGVKIFVAGDLSEAVKCIPYQSGGIEIYPHGRYFTVTGQHLDGTPTTIEYVNGALTRLVEDVQAERERQRKQRYLDKAIAGELDALKSAPAGNRNNKLYESTRALRRFVESGDISDADARQWLEDAAAETGLGLEEIRRTIDSAWNSSVTPFQMPQPAQHAATAAPASTPDQAAEQERESQAQWLIRAAQAACTLFRTPDGSLYAAATVDGHRETWPIGGRGSGLREWLIRQFFQAHGKPPSTNALTGALDVLAALARFANDVRPVSTRLAYHDDTLYLDLCDADWRALAIDANGWRVVADPPAHFRRAKGMLPLPIPTPGGSLAPLRRLLNVKADDDWMLLCGWLVGTLLPPGPADCAHLLLVGEQGSAKSTAMRLLRALVDPNESDTRPAPREERDLAIAARNSRVLSFDNLSYLPDWLSDALCRLSTGAAFATRELYSDDGETLFSAKRPSVLNGIADVATRGDLIDRCLIVSLAPIPEGQRREASAVWRTFEAMRPALLGALCTAASTALKNLPHTRLDRLPRLADFALFVEAAAPALGWQPGAFVAAYRQMRSASSSTVLESDPLADLLLHSVAEAGWQGTAAALLHDLTQRLGDGPAPRWLPKDATRLSVRLKRLAPELRRAGLDVMSTRTKRGSLIVLTPCEEDTEKRASPATPASPACEIAHPNAVSQGDAMVTLHRCAASPALSSVTHELPHGDAARVTAPVASPVASPIFTHPDAEGDAGVAGDARKHASLNDAADQGPSHTVSGRPWIDGPDRVAVSLGRIQELMDRGMRRAAAERQAIEEARACADGDAAGDDGDDLVPASLNDDDDEGWL